ncbi:hypothetical protein ACHAWF_018359 [Thalassiosira exigua]
MMDSVSNGINKPDERLGLQFNPTEDAVDTSQEIMVGTAGEAILLGDGIDLEQNNGDLMAASPQSSMGLCPKWLQRSSQKTKGLIGLTAILLVAFVAVMVAGVVQLSSSSGDEGDASNLELGQITTSDPPISDLPITLDPPIQSTVPVPTPEVSPNTVTLTSTSSPMQEYITIPISKSDIKVILPNSAGTQDWELVESAIENTIYSSLLERLPKEYSLDSIQVDRFQIQNDSEAIHTVLYTASVMVSCLVSDCNAAPDTVDGAISDMSRLESVEVFFDVEVVLTPSPTSSPPTKSPVAPTPKPTTMSPTEADTKNPTSKPTELVTAEPTRSTVLTAPANSAVLDVRQDDCNAYTPCESCIGECSDDSQCEEGLLCFKRFGYDFIPGCEGFGRPGVNYCYDPFADGLTEDMLLSERNDDESCDKKSRCEKCRGDCNDDEDCEKDLYCFMRNGFELVPGCAGQGTSGTDYCFDPADLGFGDNI